MSGFRVLETNHTGFTVADLERTVAFFRDVLGYEVLSFEPRHPEHIQHVTAIEGAEITVAYVRGPGHVLELMEYGGPADRGHVRPRPCDAGFAHIALIVDDLDAAIAACEAHGVGALATPLVMGRGPNKGNRIVYLRDPDGFAIELISRPSR